MKAADPAIRAEVIARAMAGESYMSIAASVGLSMGTVSLFARKAGVVRSMAVTLDEKAAVVERARGGESYRSISLTTGYCAAAISQWCQLAGLPKREWGAKPSPANTDDARAKARDMISRAATATSVVVATGLPASVVRALIVEAQRESRLLKMRYQRNKTRHYRGMWGSASRSLGVPLDEVDS